MTYDGVEDWEKGAEALLGLFDGRCDITAAEFVHLRDVTMKRRQREL